MIVKNKIDDIELISQISNIFVSNEFPYYWCENQIIKNNSKQYGGFTHGFYIDDTIYSAFFDLVYRLLIKILKKEKITMKYLSRIQANLLPNLSINDEELKNSIHKDMEISNYKSIIYYVIDSDGDTVIYDDNKNIIDLMTPVAGSYIIFNSDLWHRASIPKQHKKRIVINYIVEV